MTGMTPLRNGRGRIRCYWHHYDRDGCSMDGWAVTTRVGPTNHSVNEEVPVCWSHAGLDYRKEVLEHG